MSGTYVYAADVGDAVDEVTLTATVNDDGAEVSGVTLGGTAIATPTSPMGSRFPHDTVYELTERFRVTLSNPAGAALSASSEANVNITNDDAVPTASMADVTVNEGAGTMTMTLALSHESSLDVTYETTGSSVSGTATRPNDYLNFLQGAFTTITVPAGDSSATLHITIVDDTVNESDETIIIGWDRSPGIEATPTSFTFTGTITDNDTTTRRRHRHHRRRHRDRHRPTLLSVP